MIQAIDSAMAADNPEDAPSKAEVLQRLREMARYLPALEDPDFTPGEFSPLQKSESCSVAVPYVIFRDVADDFIAAAYDHGWMLHGFDWVSWARSDEAHTMCNDPSSLRGATPEQLFYLTTLR